MIKTFIKISKDNFNHDIFGFGTSSPTAYFKLYEFFITVLFSKIDRWKQIHFK